MATAAERLAVLENKFDLSRIADKERHDAILGALKNFSDGQNEMRQLQQDAFADREDLRDRIEAIQKDIAAMKPHVETMAFAKIVWRALAIMVAFVSSVAAAVWATWDHFQTILIRVIK